MAKLGRIEQVPVRSVWNDEARNFTPWLASDEGLALLSEQIGVELELVQTESRLDSYKADIVARYDGDGDDEAHYVVIENQLEATNHDHLGKIITYGAGHNADICVWVSPSFNSDHRRAIDWLNEHTEDIAFFGLEIGTIKIGNSDPAPQLKLISSPNEWARAIQASSRRETSAFGLTQIKFWQGFKDFCALHDTHFPTSRNALPKSHYNIALGRAGFRIKVFTNSFRKDMGCMLQISDGEKDQAFEKLFAHKESIEKELGYALEWQPPEETSIARAIIRHEADIENEAAWAEYYAWMHEKANAFYGVFYPLIQAI